MPDVIFLNPKTCGTYKDGRARFKTDVRTGRRTDEIDNELFDHVAAYLDGGLLPPGTAKLELEQLFKNRVMVPTYYDDRYNFAIRELLTRERLEGVSIGELIDRGHIIVRGGHGSPGNDQRSGSIPYVKVSDIRGLRVNINPTNLLSESVAARFWRASSSGLQAWDLVTPNRASSNIGEFAILLPGEERIVLTKEVYLIRVTKSELLDPFYLLWALSLKAVRDQWRRITLMQTNREDCGQRFREIIIPMPESAKWAEVTSSPFRDHFLAISQAKTAFVERVKAGRFEHVANVTSSLPTIADEDAATASEMPINNLA